MQMKQCVVSLAFMSDLQPKSQNSNVAEEKDINQSNRKEM